MSHTPAPWAFIADRRDAFGSIRPMGGEGHSLATIEWTDSGSTAANAVLISAAPKLLAAFITEQWSHKNEQFTDYPPV